MSRFITAFSLLAVMLMASVAVAAEDPNGTWKWKAKFGDREREMSLTLKLEGDKLTGSMPGRDGKETPIEDGTYKDGAVSFKITRERGGMKVVSTYTATVSGDTLKGKIDSERDGKTNSTEFEATRAK